MFFDHPIEYSWAHADFMDCCGIHAGLDHHQELAHKMLKHGNQAVGAYLDPAEILADFQLPRVIRHLRRSVGSADRGLLENEGPRITYCEDNLDDGCSKVKRVLSIKGLSVGFNAPSPREVLVQKPHVERLMRDVFLHKDEL